MQQLQAFWQVLTSNYQSALGVATSFQLRDDDQNNAVNLNNDILELNDNIKKYITNVTESHAIQLAHFYRNQTCKKKHVTQVTH